MSGVTYLTLLLFCQYTCSAYGYVAGQLPPITGSAEPSTDTEEGCKNRTALASGDNEDDYNTYYSYCGYMRQEGYHFTFNSPPFNPDLTFHEATSKLDQQYHVLKTINLTSPEVRRCHYQIQQLICLTFFPTCHNFETSQSMIYILPCKSSCESTKTECEQLLLDGGYPEWPKDIDCNDDVYNYPDDPHGNIKRLEQCIEYPKDENEELSLRCSDDSIASCDALVRTSVSSKAFSNNKFDFALKGRVLEFLRVADDKKALKVNISKDFYLSCTGDQYTEGDIVTLSTDAEYDSCCLQLRTGTEYLLMGNTVESDGTWKLRTSNEEERGGCVAAEWNEERYHRIERSWLPHCPTRVL